MGDLAVLGALLYSLATLGVQLHGFTRPPRKPGAYAVRVAVLLAWAGALLVALVGVFTFNYCESGCGSDLNLPTAGVDYHVPFGGRKGSSYGPREQGAYAKEFYTTVKTAYTLA